ncbi:MAG: TIR domain-containing protein [Planctomycetaceae bacterium]
MAETETADPPQQVFISYASADRAAANRVAESLSSAGLRVWFSEWELQPGDSIAKRIDEGLAASDVLLVLLSPNAVDSNWVRAEWHAALNSQLRNRAVTLIPVLIADCNLPPALANLKYLDLRTDFDAQIKNLTNQLGVIPDIDFSQIRNEQTFIELVSDLLADLGFQDIRREVGPQDKGYDLEASYPATDPFGSTTTETWLVELKLYREDRVNLRSIQHLAMRVTAYPSTHKGLLVTNGILTSVARDYLAEATDKARIDLRVIDGTELRQLLSKRPAIVRRYFVGDARQ